MDEIKKEIQARLQELEQEEKVCIFYACESGSRAWGFPSADSDYDVRFLYIHPQNWYLGIDVKRDVIERPSNDLIDLIPSCNQLIIYDILYRRIQLDS